MPAEDSTLLHLDMDSFFASVEIRDDPSLRGLPVVVGGTGKRSVVAAASYPARVHGIRSAMPMEQARRLCRDLVIVPGRIDHYRAVSRQVMDVMSSVCARIEQISIDEAFADVRGARRQFGPPAEIGRILRARIRDELDLPASVGIAVSRPVAKIASARAKPDGLLVVAPEETASFLAPLPVGAISGVGPAAQAALERLGVRRIGQLADVPLSTLRRALGPQAPAVLALARGEDRTGLLHREHEVSVGTERTYEEDITDPDEVRRRLTIMCDEVAASLRARDVTARGVVLKLRAPDGTTITRSATFGLPTASGERVREHVIALWERAAPGMPRVRLAGVRAEHLRPRSEQAAPEELRGRTSTWQELESAMDLARARFGSASLSRGSTLPRERAASPEPDGDRGPSGPVHPSRS
ncbi:DNA polymerase IV [Brachybacterium huguangmaarense]